MPRNIIVVCDRDRRAEVPIDSRVTRIGSDPQCELRLTGGDAAPHVATLEARGGLFLLHNRSTSGLLLEDHDVAANQSVPWVPGQTLRLGNDLALRLDVVADALPSVRRRANIGGTPDEQNSTSPSPDPSPDPGGKNKDAAYITGIILVIFAAGLSFLMEATSPAQKARDAFSALVTVLQDGEPGAKNDPARAYFCSEIQAARIAELRGDEGQAREIYGRVRDALMEHRRPDGSFRKPWLENVLMFVKRRLR